MGIFTDYLVITNKKRLLSKYKIEPPQKDVEEKKEGEPIMAEPQYIATANRDIPNEGIPPNRLLEILHEPCNDPPASGEPRASEQVQVSTAPQPADVVMPQITCNYYVTNFNYPHQGDAAGNSSIIPSADTHTWIKLVLHGIRPCVTFPRPFLGQINGCTRIMPKSTKIKDLLTGFLALLNLPLRDGFGIQQVERLEDGRWIPEAVFAWNGGDATKQIGATGLGNGTEGQEVYVCSWYQ